MAEAAADESADTSPCTSGNLLEGGILLVDLGRRFFATPSSRVDYQCLTTLYDNSFDIRIIIEVFLVKNNPCLYQTVIPQDQIMLSIKVEESMPNKEVLTVTVHAEN